MTPSDLHRKSPNQNPSLAPEIDPLHRSQTRHWGRHNCRHKYRDLHPHRYPPNLLPPSIPHHPRDWPPRWHLRISFLLLPDKTGSAGDHLSEKDRQFHLHSSPRSPHRRRQKLPNTAAWSDAPCRWDSQNSPRLLSHRAP